MDASDQPYLSVVIAARNDGYAGGMLRRLQVCIDAFLTQAERFDIPSELILVDWNPPPGNDLWRAVSWSHVGQRCGVRVITVPDTVHQRCRFSDRLPILIHCARNVGVRRARGEFVLPTSADILLSDELAAWIGERKLDPWGMYRLARHDVPEDTLTYDSHDERLTYCRSHVMQVHTRERSYAVSGLPRLFTNAAGDFTLLSREMYFRLHGIPEEREFHSMHFDSVMCFMAHAAGAKEIEIADPLRIYHVDHGAASWRKSPGWLERVARRVPGGGKRVKRLIKLARRITPPTSVLDRRGVPHLDCSTPAGRAQYEALIRKLALEPDAFRYNAADWGLAQYELEERVPHRQRLE
jgi:hypothetical protein